MKHDYEYAFEFEAYSPDYLNKGQKNAYNYKITGCFNTGDYWCEVADNKVTLELAMAKIYANPTIVPNTIALQNKFGQLMWTREFGWNNGIKHPKYMDGMKCFEVRNW